MPKPSRTELDGAAVRDLLTDAETAEQQADEGPFYPEKGITRQSLLDYAARCRAAVTKYSDGGAHDAVILGHW